MASLAGDDEEFRSSAWEALRGAWSEQRVVSLFTRFHPLLANHELCATFRGASHPQGDELLPLGRSVSVDLRLDTEERRRTYPKVVRQEIRRARRAGIEVDLDREWKHFDAFVELYSQTMEHNHAEKRYLFSRQYLEVRNYRSTSLRPRSSAREDTPARRASA